MVALTALWLPILLSAVVVFVASTIIHTALHRWHSNDFRKLPAEDAVLDAVRAFNLAPDEYVAPRPGSTKEASSPEYQAKVKRGPRIMLNVLRPEISIPRSLVLWFVYGIVVAVFAAYIAGLTLGAGAPYMTVFRVTGTATFAAYALALWHDWIWYSAGLARTIRSTIDGLVYGLLAGGVFGWLWP
jgi:hypothetical protein